MYNILICDDELDIVRALKIYLTDPGYTFFEAHNGQEALEIVSNEEIHLILMDVMMPVMDGIEATAKLRTFSNVPIIFLTAKSEEADMLLGLNIGADDYITKPFNPMEVSARVRSHLRRYMLLGGGNIRQDVLRIGNIELDYRAKAVTVDGDPISLTPTEYEILKLLMQNPGQVFPPKSIYQTIWKETPWTA